MTRLVEPSVLGLFSGIALTLGYAPFLQIGVSNGLSRELPYYIGKSDRDHAYELASSAQAWMIFIGGLTALILLMVALYNLIQGDLWLAAGWGAHVVLVFLLFYSNQYLQTTYRTANDFARLSMVNVVHALVSLMLLALVWVLDFYGLCLRAVFTAMIAAGLFHYWRPVRVKPGWNFQHIKHLFCRCADIIRRTSLFLLGSDQPNPCFIVHRSSRYGCLRRGCHDFGISDVVSSVIESGYLPSHGGTLWSWRQHRRSLPDDH